MLKCWLARKMAFFMEWQLTSNQLIQKERRSELGFSNHVQERNDVGRGDILVS
jgi:hypothetical protein